VNQETTESQDGQDNTGDGQIERVVQRFAFHSQRVDNFTEVEFAAISVISFRYFSCNVHYLPIAAFHKAI